MASVVLDSAVWFLTFKCNMACRYCYEVVAQEMGDSKYAKTPWDPTPDRYLAAWNKLKPRILDLTGGEVTLLSYWLELFEKLDPAIKLGWTTNLSHEMTHFVEKIDPKRFINITCSFHPSQNGTLKQPMNPDLFLGRVLLLKNRGFPVCVNFVMWPEQMWLVDKYKKMFEDYGIRFHIDAYSSISYYPFKFTDKENQFIQKYLGKDRAPDPLALKYGQNYQVMCSGGQTHLSVQPDGTAWRCVLEYQMQINKVGNIFEPGFELLPAELPCNEHFRCPGCDRDKVKVKFVKEIDRKAEGLEVIPE